MRVEELSLRLGLLFRTGKTENKRIRGHISQLTSQNAYGTELASPRRTDELTQFRPRDAPTSGSEAFTASYTLT